MNIQNPPSARDAASGSRLLEGFQQTAATHDAVHITLDGVDWQVQGVGVMPQSRRSVAWVSGADGTQPDTASVFVDALKQSFSSGISTAIARLLDLQPAPGQPLASRTVTQALEMAKTGQQVLSGVDFFTRLQFSAVSDGSEFRRVCADTDRSSADLDLQERQRIDAQLDQQFAQAQSQGASPVGYEQAEQWLRQALSR